MNDMESVNEDLKVATRMLCSSKGTYVVVCDDSIVLGMELADRLVKQGARKLVLRMKPNSLAGYCYLKLLSWNKLNVTVKISTDNLQTEKGCVNLLKEGAKLGPILGIFIVQNYSGTESLESEDFATKFNNTAGVVAKLDMTSRNICNELDHFVVLNYSIQNVSDEYMVSVTDEICHSRKEIRLPALSFRTGLLKELDEDNPERSRTSISATFNALESSLVSKHSIAISFGLDKNVTAVFIQRASVILGVKDLNSIDKNIRLKNLLLTDDLIEKINCLIQEAFHINFDIDTIREMSIGDLINFGNNLPKSKPKVNDGLETFFTYIDSDECDAAEPMVTMATTFSSVKEEDELDPKATYLMLVPGFEGHHGVFGTVCERLKIQAVAFQYGPEVTDADVPEIAAEVMKFMKKRFQLNDKFYILGYSFGVNVALELAALYEKEGHVGIVYCLDSSPDALRAQFDAHVGNLTDAQLQNNLVQHMYHLMNGQDSKELVKKLEQTDSWEKKIEVCVTGLRGIVNISHQYQRCILQGAYRRIMLAREYQPDFKLQSELVLIKGTAHPKMRKLDNDYGLSRYTTKPVKVFEIDADHASIPYDCRVTSIVNKLLEPKLLEEFKNKNQCLSYLANPNKKW